MAVRLRHSGYVTQRRMGVWFMRHFGNKRSTCALGASSWASLSRNGRHHSPLEIICNFSAYQNGSDASDINKSGSNNAGNAEGRDDGSTSPEFNGRNLLETPAEYMDAACYESGPSAGYEGVGWSEDVMVDGGMGRALPLEYASLSCGDDEEGAALEGTEVHTGAEGWEVNVRAINGTADLPRPISEGDFQHDTLEQSSASSEIGVTQGASEEGGTLHRASWSLDESGVYDTTGPADGWDSAGNTTNEFMNPIEASVGRLTLSFTRVKTFETCPRQYYWRYVRMVEVKPTLKMVLGEALHDVVADVAKAKKEGRGMPTVDEAKDMFLARWQQHPVVLSPPRSFLDGLPTLADHMTNNATDGHIGSNDVDKVVKEIGSRVRGEGHPVDRLQDTQEGSTSGDEVVGAGPEEDAGRKEVGVLERKGLRVISKFIQREMERSFDERSPELIESHFQVPISEEISFQGYFDRVDRLGSESGGGVEIVEYKTQLTREAKEVAAAGQDLQTRLYTWSYGEIYGELPRSVKLESLTDGSNVTLDVVEAFGSDFVRAHRRMLLQIGNTILQLSADIESSSPASTHGMSSWEARGGLHCIWCQYQRVCESPRKRSRRRRVSSQ